mgnify:CR=1 FL=1
MSFARLKDLNLHYLQHGQGDPILLLHGLGSSSYDWEFQVPAFSKHFRVIAPCLRGFGDSDKPPGPYSIDLFAKDMIALLDHLGIERCHVMGFSMGGAIAFQMAIDQPQRLSSLIVVNSQPSFELDHWRAHLMVITRIGMASVLGLERMTRYVAKRLFPRPDQAALRQRMHRTAGEESQGELPRGAAGARGLVGEGSHPRSSSVPTLDHRRRARLQPARREAAATLQSHPQRTARDHQGQPPRHARSRSRTRSIARCWISCSCAYGALRKSNT